MARAYGLTFYRRFCALSPSTFRAQADRCTGITTEANAPFGAYAFENTAVTFQKITDLNAVTFTLDLGFGMGVKGYTGGAFVGSEFSLQGTSPPAEEFAKDNLDIQWCPNQNYFQVTVFGVTTNTLRSQATAVVPASCDSSWFVSPPAPVLSSAPA